MLLCWVKSAVCLHYLQLYTTYGHRMATEWPQNGLFWFEHLKTCVLAVIMLVNRQYGMCWAAQLHHVDMFMGALLHLCQFSCTVAVQRLCHPCGDRGITKMLMTSSSIHSELHIAALDALKTHCQIQPGAEHCCPQCAGRTHEPNVQRYAWYESTHAQPDQCYVNMHAKSALYCSAA